MNNIDYKKILVTHDGSRLASSVIPHAIYLASTYNSDVILFEAVPSIAQEMALIESAGFYHHATEVSELITKTVTYNKEQALINLKKIKTQFEISGITKVEIYIEEGSPEEEIISLAKREHCDLIIMATHGRSGLGRTLLGSVADHVVRHASCPVLIVHPKPGK